MDDTERRWPAWLPWRRGRRARRDDGVEAGDGADAADGAEEAGKADRADPESGTGPRTALVTGCDSPVGRASAARLAAAGWRVHATAADPGALGGLEEAGCETAELDVTADANVAGVVRRVLEADGGVDCLVVVPRAGPLGPVEDVSADRLGDGLDAAVVGHQRLLGRLLPHMRERGEGRVVTVTSALGRVGVPGAAGVCAPAAALARTTEALRAEVGPHGVDAVLVETGPVAGGDGDPFGSAGRASSEGRKRGGSSDEGDGATARRRSGGSGSVAGDGGRTDGRTRSTATGRRVEADEDGERTDAYASLYDALDDARIVGSALGAVPPERVADAVLNAATCADPPPRYGVGRAVQVARVAALLPPRWRDRAFGVVRRLP